MPIVEDQAHVPRQLSHFLGDAEHPAGVDHADGEAAQTIVFRAVAHPALAAVLVKVPIENVVTAVLDGPVPTVNLEHLSGSGLLGRETGAAVGEVERISPCFCRSPAVSMKKAWPTCGKSR